VDGLGAVKGGAHHLLERVPRALDLECAGFESCHRQQVRDQPVQPSGLVGDAPQHLALRHGIQAVLVLEQCRGGAGDDRERRPQVV